MIAFSNTSEASNWTCVSSDSENATDCYLYQGNLTLGQPPSEYSGVFVFSLVFLGCDVLMLALAILILFDTIRAARRRSAPMQAKTLIVP
jgi:hypothetical protein